MLMLPSSSVRVVRAFLVWRSVLPRRLAPLLAQSGRRRNTRQDERAARPGERREQIRPDRRTLRSLRGGAPRSGARKLKPSNEKILNGLDDTLRRGGYAFLPAAQTQALAAERGSLADWDSFAASWNDLYLDMHMADGGRYRRRRYAVFTLGADGSVLREPHQPHWQGVDYNPLNGGVERWFEPVTEDTGGSSSLRSLLALGGAIFGRQAPQVASWHVEMHQFRIEARPGEAGQPTPEGPHRDGVDYVLVLLITRRNIEQGTTVVYDLERRELGSFTLTQPFDTALVDDARVYHGVTAVTPLDPAQPAYRDVLVLTFRAQPARAGA